MIIRILHTLLSLRIFKNDWCIIFVVVAWICFQANGLTQQNIHKGIGIHSLHIKPQYGFVTPHHRSIRYMLDENIYGFEVLAGKMSEGKDYWEDLYRYPSYGIGYSWSYLGNREITGYAHGLYTFIDISVRPPERKFNVNYAVQFGLSYLTRKFDLEENPVNIAISSHMNVFVGLDMYASFKLTPRLILTSGLDLTHYSNGKIKSPNLGINTMVYHVSLKAITGYPDKKEIKQNTPDIGKRHSVYTILSSGLKSDDQLSDKVYVASSLTTEYLYTLSHKYKLGLGVDFTYDGTIGENMIHSDFESYKKTDLYRFGMHFTFASRYKKLMVAISAGAYLKSTYSKYGNVYDRIGIRYILNRHILFNLAIRAHYAVADYIEWGIGWKW